MVLVKPGEAIAADGVIVEGDTAIELVAAHRRKQAAAKAAGDAVPGGAVNATQAVVVRVIQAGARKHLVDAGAADRTSRAGQAADGAVGGQGRGLVRQPRCCCSRLPCSASGSWSIRRARWLIAIAVLVVSCPCALSLATPTALAAATDRLVRQGVLVVQPHVLETLHRATHIVFDKTGTLTTGRPVAARYRAAGSAGCQTGVLRARGALEASSAHPLAQAIVAAARARRGMAARRSALRGRAGLEGSGRGRALSCSARRHRVVATARALPLATACRKAA